MNPIPNAASVNLSLNPMINENADVSAEANKIEAHKKKSEKIKAEDLFKIGSDKRVLDAVKVTNYSLPVVSSDKKPDFSSAKEYVNSDKFENAMRSGLPSFSLDMFGRGFDFFKIIAEMNNLMRKEVTQSSAAITNLRDKINISLRENIINKGREGLAMSVSSAFAGMAISAAGTTSLGKNAVKARTDLKENQTVLPKQQAKLSENESKLAGLDPKKPADKQTISMLKEQIGDDKAAIENLKFKSAMVQNRVDSNQVKGMAVQSASASVASVIDGVGLSVNALNEAGVVNSQASGEMTAEMAQKLSDLINEQREAFNKAMQAMQDLTAQQSSLYSTVAGNVR